MVKTDNQTDINEGLEATSPLQGLNPLDNDKIKISECALKGKISLRGATDDKIFTQAVKKILNATLPDQVMSSADCNDGKIYCTAFDEWLILLKNDQPEATMTELKKAMANAHHALVDVTDYYVEIAVSGESCLDLMAKGIAIDLHENSFGIGQGTYTNWHQANIFLMRDGVNEFRLMVRWSFARYLWDYLMDSAREYKS